MKLSKFSIDFISEYKLYLFSQESNLRTSPIVIYIISILFELLLSLQIFILIYIGFIINFIVELYKNTQELYFFKMHRQKKYVNDIYYSNNILEKKKEKKKI